MNRDSALAVYSGLYTVYRQDRHLGEYYKCLYCGEPADTIDHQPPITRVSDYRALGLEREVYVTVPCCGECNALLADELTETLSDREALLKRKLARKYRKHITSKQWTDDDIEDSGLKGRLREYVQGHARYRERIVDRIEYKQGIRAYLISLDKGICSFPNPHRISLNRIQA